MGKLTEVIGTDSEETKKQILEEMKGTFTKPITEKTKTKQNPKDLEDEEGEEE